AKPDAEPCLVLLDLAMYPTNGAEVLKAISQTDLGEESLVVMLSGIRDIKAVQQGYELGARTFLIKPLTTEDVMSFLETVKTRIRVEQNDKGYVLRWDERALET